jgi:hypothetical protein
MHLILFIQIYRGNEFLAPYFWKHCLTRVVFLAFDETATATSALKTAQTVVQTQIYSAELLLVIISYEMVFISQRTNCRQKTMQRVDPQEKGTLHARLINPIAVDKPFVLSVDPASDRKL